ncbi:MAG: hypothetical protein V4674_00700 [Patescibacteria group bacterium]
MESLLLAYLPHSVALGYLLVFLGMAIEGELVLFTALYLANIGYFSYQNIGLVLVVGIFASDFFWYRFGAFLHNHPRFSRARAFLERVTRLIDDQLAIRPIHTFIVSKFIYGLNRTTLARAGVSGMGVTKFLEADILAVVTWLFVIGGAGYALSESLENAARYIKYAEVGLLIGILAFIIITQILSKILFITVKKDERKAHERRARPRI